MDYINLQGEIWGNCTTPWKYLGESDRKCPKITMWSIFPGVIHGKKLLENQEYKMKFKMKEQQWGNIVSFFQNAVIKNTI